MRQLSLALLLAYACLVSGQATQDGLVQTDTYKCDPTTCVAPTCHCAAYAPPGGLTKEETPQFVMVSHDNALDGLPYDIMMGVLGDKKQSNGCPVPVTWFAMFYHSDCTSGKKALARGDEVAMQTNRFNPTDPFTATDPAPKYDSRDPKTGEPSVAIEISMSRKHWHEYCNISYSDMVGYRSPNYYNNPAIRKALSEEGYLYDATLVERYYTNSPTSPSVDQVLWPYTMDAGIPQECNFMGDEIGKCAPKENYAGLWEVPLYQAQIGGMLYGVGNYGDAKAMQPPIDDMNAFLKGLLDERLAHSKAPLSISTIYEWMIDKTKKIDPTCDNAGCEYAPSANAAALGKFVDYALTKPDVRFVTYSDLIRWMQDPVPLSQFDDWVKCTTPGIKADLTAVNLTDAEKANAFYMLEQTPVVMPVPAPAPAPVPVAVQAPAPAPAVVVDEAPAAAPAVAPVAAVPVVAPTPMPAASVPTTETPAPAPEPITTTPSSGALSLGSALAAGAAMLAAVLLSM